MEHNAPSWAPREVRRPHEASDTSESEEEEHGRQAAPYEVKHRLGPIQYGESVNYYQTPNLGELTYLQKLQMHTDPNLVRRDKKRRIIQPYDTAKLEQRKADKIQRWQQKHRNRSPSNSDGTHESDYEPESETKIPTTSSYTINGHNKAINDISIDNQGKLMATSGADYLVQLWDFRYMDNTFTPWRHCEPVEKHVVSTTQFSLDGSNLLIAAGGCSARIFSRDGRPRWECAKGDMYIRDMFHTTGHINTITDAAWHPTLPKRFLTASTDSTVRVWDIDGRLVGLEQNLGHSSVHKAFNQAYKPVGLTCWAWISESQVTGGSNDGSIHIWNASSGDSARPIHSAHWAHRGSVTSMKAVENGFASRSHDGTLKIWDIRRFENPVQTFENLPIDNYKSQIEIVDDLVLTGTSNGTIVAFNIKTNAQVLDHKISSVPVVSLKWVPTWKQLIWGLSSGELVVLYDETSKDGFVKWAKRAPKQFIEKDMPLERPIIAPFINPAFKNQRQKPSAERNLSKKPSEPLFYPSSDNRMNGIQTLNQHILSTIYKRARPDDDSVDTLRKYQKVVDNDSLYVDSAYKRTQPVKEFDRRNDVPLEKQFLDSIAEPKCDSCGHKACVCQKRRTTEEPMYNK